MGRDKILGVERQTGWWHQARSSGFEDIHLVQVDVVARLESLFLLRPILVNRVQEALPVRISARYWIRSVVGGCRQNRDSHASSNGAVNWRKFT